MKDSTPKLKLKQFQSKYPFKQESRNNIEILYEGHIDNLPLTLSEQLHEDNVKLKEDTKFIIVYQDAK